MEGDLMLFKAAGYDFACLCLRSLLNIERADASASTSTRYVLRYSRTSDWNWCGSAPVSPLSEVGALIFTLASSIARSTPPIGTGKRDTRSRRALASSLVVADSIGTSSSKRGSGLASISTSSKKPPNGTDAARGPDVAVGGADEVAPWLRAACWRGRTVSGCTDSGIGLCDRPLPEGLELLGGEPPAKAAPRDRTRRPGMRVGRCESLTAEERVVGARPDMIRYQKKCRNFDGAELRLSGDVGWS